MISLEHCPYDTVDTVRYVIQYLLELPTQLTTDRSNRTVPPSLSAHSTRYCDAPAQGEHPSTDPRPSFLCRALQHSISTSLVCPTRRTAPDSALLPTLRHQCCHQHRVYPWGYFLIARFSPSCIFFTRSLQCDVWDGQGGGACEEDHVSTLVTLCYVWLTDFKSG